MPAEKLLKQLNKMLLACPRSSVEDGCAWRFDFPADRQERILHKQDLVNAAIDEVGALVLAVPEGPLDASKLRSLGLAVMAQSPDLCYVDHLVDFEALYEAAYLEIGYWYLFHPCSGASVGRFLTASERQAEPESLIRSGITDFVITADVDDDAWTVAIHPALK